MKAVLDFVAEHGAMLALGTTVLLSLALALVFVHRQPIHRQRIAEASMVLCVLFLVLACIPLPRFDLKRKAPLAPRPLPLYTLQPGDEVIAAEVFKVPKESSVPGRTGIGVPLPMPPGHGQLHEVANRPRMKRNPHPNPLPAYRERGKRRHAIALHPVTARVRNCCLGHFRVTYL